MELVVDEHNPSCYVCAMTDQLTITIENDQELVKTLESIMNLTVKIEERLNPAGTEPDYPDTEEEILAAYVLSKAGRILNETMKALTYLKARAAK